MSTIELKPSIRQQLEKTKDEKLLQQIQSILHTHFHTPIDELGGQTLQEFNDEMDEAEAEIDAGEFYTHDEVVEMSKKWLEE